MQVQEEIEERILSFGQIEGVLCDGLIHVFRSCSVSMGKTVIWEEVSMIFNNFYLFSSVFSGSFFVCFVI